jgi:uncharacterized membrane protein
MRFGAARFFRTFALPLVVMGIWSVALAVPPSLEVFTDHYSPPDGSPLARAECTTCHAGPRTTALNPFGQDVQAEKHRLQAQSITRDLLDRLLALDSDGDGFTNFREIQAGSLPGDPRSTPQTLARDARWAGLFPAHSYHPLIVHFPIALFLFGAFLDVLGKLRRRPEMRMLARWNLAAGALGALVALGSGFAAWQRSGRSLEGNLALHLWLAIPAAVLVVSLTVWRLRHARADGRLYWVALVGTSAILAAAGHFGSAIVHG